MPAYRSFVQHEHRHARRAIVQPRWGNHIAVSPITRGTRHGREPRAMECNAFGVRAIGHIVRLRNDGPLGTPVGRIGYAVRMHRVQRLDPRSIRMHQRITSTTNWFLRRRRYIPKPRVAAPAAHPGFTCRAESKPQRGFTKAGCRVPTFARHEHRHARWAIVQPRWGNHIAVHRITRGTRRGRDPRLWNVTPSAYVPLVISSDYAITVHRVHRSDASGTPYGTETPTGFYKCGEIHIICVSQTTKM